MRNVTLADAPSVVARSPYQYERIGDAVAYLNVPTFDLGQRDAFRAFVDEAFSNIQAEHIGTLIIDLRENGGGAHDVSDILLAHLADRPVAATARVTARVTSENIARLPGATLGDVVTVPFRQAYTPPEGAFLFDGEVYVLIGKLTYSQAIVFATALQDHQLATIVGEETEGPANQSAQVQTHPLTQTGLEALAPLYIFTRANGESGRRGVIPDILIEETPGEPRHTVEALLARLGERR